VPRGNLLKKLYNLYKISDHWLRDYLTDRYEFVNVGTDKSNCLKTLVGVPAGSILGPRLFSLYLNDMEKVLNYGKVLNFADDSTFLFFGQAKLLSELQSRVDTDMTEVLKYVHTNKMSLHKGKNKLLLLGSKTNVALMNNFYVQIKNVIVMPTDKLKCVGATLDSHLTWKFHIDDMAKRCYYRIRCLYAVKSYFSQNSLRIIGLSIVVSLLNYMSCVWGVTSKQNLCIAEKVIRSLARLVLNKRKYDPVASDIKLDLKWLFPQEMSEFRSLCNMFKIVKFNNVPYFSDYFSKINNVHEHSTRTCNNNYRSIKPRTEYAKNSFNFKAISLWNALPQELQNISQYPLFQSKLKEYLLKRK
jgi:hypothetical protein